jgi:mRNA-degrading endonuclease RelE of RelBE toxin-antitoxin system
VSYQLIIAPSAARDLERLEDEIAKEIRRFLEGPLRREPYRAGRPLGVLDPADPRSRGRGDLPGQPPAAPRVPPREEEIPSATMFEATEKTWRVLYRIDKNTRIVRVMVIAHKPKGGRRLPEPAPQFPFANRFR